MSNPGSGFGFFSALILIIFGVSLLLLHGYMYHIAKQIIPYMSALGSAKEQKQIGEFNIKLQRKYRFSLSARATLVIRLEDQEFILCGS